MQITINEATILDFSEVIDLYKQLWEKWDLFDEDKLKAIYQTDLETGRKIYFVARDENKIVGLCTLVVRDNIHYLKIGLIDELVVDKDYRHQGIGKMLLDKVMDIAKEKGCYRVELHSNMERIETHRFYENNGFEKKQYYFIKKC